MADGGESWAIACVDSTQNPGTNLVTVLPK